MASASKTHTDDGGFTMEFSLDVFSNIEQDVEDVARQGALGNFRRARRMYEEALEPHRDMFPVYAEYLRLCLDSGDWESLAKVADQGSWSWSESASGIVEVLSAVGNMSKQKDGNQVSAVARAYNGLFISAARSLHRNLGYTNCDDWDNEETFVAVIMLPLRHYGPVSEALLIGTIAAEEVPSTWESSASDMGTLVKQLLRQDQFWAAEMVLKTLFLESFSLTIDDSLRNDQIKEAWTSIQWFVENEHLQYEEQELWAMISILQTFCEGLLGVCGTDETSNAACDWSLPKVISLLRKLVERAISRDETEEWSRSRGHIRHQLLEFDSDLANIVRGGNIVWSRTMFETLLDLCENAKGNQDYIMESSIHWRIQTLGYRQGSKATADLSSIPIKVYMQCEKNLAAMADSDYSKMAGGGYEWWPSPSKAFENDGQKVHSHKTTKANEQRSLTNSNQQGEAEPARTRDPPTKRSLAPAENLWALLDGEREANRDLQQKVQMLRRLITNLTEGAREVDREHPHQEIEMPDLPTPGIVPTRIVHDSSLDPGETSRGRLSRSEGPSKASRTRSRSASPDRPRTRRDDLFTKLYDSRYDDSKAPSWSRGRFGLESLSRPGDRKASDRSGSRQREQDLATLLNLSSL